jgi:transcriptional regulator with XRE-family HTH domain
MSKSKNSKSKAPTLIINRLAIILKEERRSNRWLASEIGFTETTISKWVNNVKQPNIFIFYLIALVLKRNLQDLFVTTETVTEGERIKHLKILAEMVEKGKRTGKGKI